MLQEKTKSFDYLIHRWGGSISEAVHESICQNFQIPEIDGFIGYHLAYGCAVILGDPICAPENKPILAEAFQKFCQANRLTCIYFIASKEFAKWAMDHVCKIMIEVGEETIFDPFLDPTAGPAGAKLRNNIHHANHLGLSVKEYLSYDSELEKSILDLGKLWVKARQGPQIYLGKLNFFENRTGKRWFYLQNEKQQPIGMALLSRLEVYQGWLLKFLITLPEVPRGGSELLMTSILDTLRQENCHFVTYGMIPSNHLREIKGLGKLKASMAKALYKIAKWIFHLGQRKDYWHKFHPHFESSYLLFSNQTISLKEMLALAHAMKIDF